MQWTAAIRLAAWEKSRLEEIYTAHLIRITLNDGECALASEAFGGNILRGVGILIVLFALRSVATGLLHTRPTLDMTMQGGTLPLSSRTAD